jgi:uncharacterized protein (DUF1499 family)
MINDITTDLVDPPMIRKVTGDSVSEHLIPYPSSFAASQRESYRELEPLKLEVELPEALRVLKELFSELRGASLIYEDLGSETSYLQLTFTTPILRFTDDVALRIRNTSEPGMPSCIIDMRSRSRLGTADFGTNAKRIKSVLNLLKGRIDDTRDKQAKRGL